MKSNPPTVVVHIVDDDESFRNALARLLRAADYTVCTYESAGDFLVRRTRQSDGCILIDIRMPGPSGLDLYESLSNDGEVRPIIFLSAFGDIPIAVRALKAGAFDFLTKPVDRDTLLDTLRRALAFNAASRARREQLRDWRTRLDTLSVCEREVFERVVSGQLNKQIAADLGKAERTVKAQRAAIMDKMHATSLAELVHMADALGVDTPPLLVAPTD